MKTYSSSPWWRPAVEFVTQSIPQINLSKRCFFKSLQFLIKQILLDGKNGAISPILTGSVYHVLSFCF